MQTQIIQTNRPVQTAGKVAAAAGGTAACHVKWTTVCLLLGLCAVQMQAQFNGPAGQSATTENKPTVVTTDPTILRPATHDFILGQGDQLAVNVYGIADYAQSVLVNPDGTLTLPLIGKVDLTGLNIAQAEQLIATKLSDAGMVRNPQVTITVVEAPNQVATVSGEVRAPGLVPVIGQRTLLEVLTAAGGIAPTGSHVITILRPGVPNAIVVDLGSDPASSKQADIPIFAGDSIIVPRTGVVYAIGAFRAQGSFPLSNSNPLTMLQVCALAGGIPFEAQRNGARIIRTIGTDRKEIKVDLERVELGKDPDPIMEPDDIVFVPTSQMKAALRAGGISTILAVFYASTIAP